MDRWATGRWQVDGCGSAEGSNPSLYASIKSWSQKGTSDIESVTSLNSTSSPLLSPLSTSECESYLDQSGMLSTEDGEEPSRTRSRNETTLRFCTDGTSPHEASPQYPDPCFWNRSSFERCAPTLRRGSLPGTRMPR